MATDNATAAGNDAIFSLEQMRGAYEHRALWLHYMAEKAVEDGENGPLHQAIRKCGLYHADARFAPFTSMDDFDEVFHLGAGKERLRDGDHREGRRHAVDRLPLLPAR